MSDLQEAIARMRPAAHTIGQRAWGCWICSRFGAAGTSLDWIQTHARYGIAGHALSGHWANRLWFVRRRG